MKPTLAVTLATLATATLSHGGPEDRVILAVARLAEQPNYGWTSTIVDDARAYEVVGQTERSGYTTVRLPMVTAIARRLGRDADTVIDAVFKGRVCAILTPRGWKTPAELPRRSDDWRDEAAASRSVRLAVPRAAPGRWATGVLEDEFPFAALPPLDEDDAPEERRPYSNAQLASYLPHDDLAIIISSYACLKVEGNVATGRLSDTGARLLLVRDGDDQPTPLCAAGAFRLFIEGGMVTKYLVRLEGIVSVDRKRIRVHQISSTVIRNVGGTRVVVEEELQRKLAG